jgi:hypothetical protein
MRLEAKGTAAGVRSCNNTLGSKGYQLSCARSLCRGVESGDEEWRLFFLMKISLA